jgi:TnpA family transposase
VCTINRVTPFSLVLDQSHFIRNETLVEASACLVAERNRIPLVHLWGGGEVASADGVRFVVPIRTLHAGPNPKYFGYERCVTDYNLIPTNSQT